MLDEFAAPRAPCVDAVTVQDQPGTQGIIASIQPAAASPASFGPDRIPASTAALIATFPASASSKGDSASPTTAPADPAQLPSSSKSAPKITTVTLGSADQEFSDFGRVRHQQWTSTKVPNFLFGFLLTIFHVLTTVTFIDKILVPFQIASTFIRSPSNRLTIFAFCTVVILFASSCFLRSTALEIALAGTVTNPNGYLNLVLKNDLSDKHLTPHGKFAVCLGAAIQIGSTGFLLCTEQFHVRVSSNFPDSLAAGDISALAVDDDHNDSSVKDNAVALSAAGDVRDFSARNPSVTLQSALHKDPEQPTSSLSVRFDESAQHNITPSDSLARTKDHAHHTWQKIGSSTLADAADRELVEFYSSFWY
jgi:hypothetical protein